MPQEREEHQQANAQTAAPPVQRNKQDMEDMLEAALEETFPASDPVALVSPTHAGAPDHHRRC